VAIPPYFCVCLVQPSLCHEFARALVSELLVQALRSEPPYVWGPAQVADDPVNLRQGLLAAELYEEGMRNFDAGKSPTLASVGVPKVAREYYGLPSSASFRDVMQNIRADDIFHAQFNKICADHCCETPMHHLKALVGTGKASQDGSERAMQQ
jgi:hypothetical protein